MALYYPFRLGNLVMRPSVVMQIRIKNLRLIFEKTCMRCISVMQTYAFLTLI